MDITVILSGLSDVEKVREYYSKSVYLIPEFKRRQEKVESKLKELKDASKGIPSLV